LKAGRPTPAKPGTIMLGTFRKLANTFVARVFFVLLAAAFVG
jgi:hypothetical protein